MIQGQFVVVEAYRVVLFLTNETLFIFTFACWEEKCKNVAILPKTCMPRYFTNHKLRKSWIFDEI